MVTQTIQERKETHKVIGISFEMDHTKEIENVCTKLGYNVAGFCRVAVLRMLREEQSILNKNKVVEE